MNFSKFAHLNLVLHFLEVVFVGKLLVILMSIILNPLLRFDNLKVIGGSLRLLKNGKFVLLSAECIIVRVLSGVDSVDTRLHII